MATKNRQVGIRADLEMMERFCSLVDRVRKATGLKLSRSDVFRLAVIELEKHYPTSKRKGHP